MPTSALRDFASGLLKRERRPDPRGPRRPIETTTDDSGSDVDSYWNKHTVKAESFLTVEESKANLEWRFAEYPLFREFSGLWGGHSGETVLDYGCGPGNDLTGFALHSEAARIIGVDVSRKALELAADRLALHHVDPERIALVQTSDAEVRIPLEDASVDFLQSQGVLMVTSDPPALVEELFRVLKPGGDACFMIYNRDSLWFHLWTAYVRQVLQGRWSTLSAEEAFARNTDGEECPVSRAYRHAEFSSMCAAAGFECDYVGGYLSRHELKMLDEHWATALADSRLRVEHREFLRSLRFDRGGYPMHAGYHAGIGGTYWARKPTAS
jgi:ubiquinone/menaquinone biosynthesis C-methylase UbiE